MTEIPKNWQAIAYIWLSEFDRIIGNLAEAREQIAEAVAQDDYSLFTEVAGRMVGLPDD